MQSYKINDNLTIEAWTYETRYNWGHKARAIYNGREIAETKIVYQNRTWEAYKYQSVMEKLIDVLDTESDVPLRDRIQASNFIKHGDGRELRSLKIVGALAQMSAVLASSEEQANAYQTKILGTIDGLDVQALDGLDEKTKAERLAGVINILTK